MPYQCERCETHLVPMVPTRTSIGGRLASNPVMPNDSSLVAIGDSPMRLILSMSWLSREFHGGGQQRLIDVQVVLEIAQQYQWQF
jgi:hypothetical protein